MSKIISIIVLVILCSSFLIFTDTANSAETGFGFHGGYINSKIMDPGFYVGVQVRSRLSPAFGYEVAFDYRDEKTEDTVLIRDPANPGEVDATIIAKSYPLTGTLLFTLFAERTVPLNLMGGIGFYFYSWKFRPEGLSESSETDFSFGYHLGAGTEFDISLGVKFHTGIKYLFLELEDEYGDIVLSEAEANAFLINLGLTFYL